MSLTVTYSNNSNNINELIFQDGWVGRIYLDTDITKLEVEYDDNVQKDASMNDIVLQSTVKQYYTFNFGAKNNYVEALKIISLCNHVVIKDEKGEIFIAKDIKFSINKKEGSYYNCSFRFYTKIIINRGENKL